MKGKIILIDENKNICIYYKQHILKLTKEPISQIGNEDLEELLYEIKCLFKESEE